MATLDVGRIRYEGTLTLFRSILVPITSLAYGVIRKKIPSCI